MTLSPDQPASALSSPDAAEPGPSEAVIVRAAAAGCARAFEQLVQSNQRRVFCYLSNMVRHRQDAEDLTQQTFLKAFQHLGTFDCARPLINWLLTIARRTALNHFRDHKKWEHMAGDVVSDAPSPARRLEQQDHAENLWNRARRLLAPREFEVLWLRFSEELSTKETAQVMNLTQIHIKVLVHRARQQLLKGEIRP
jgi:RNA polymerase sigma-70 factor, ECF subfamily